MTIERLHIDEEPRVDAAYEEMRGLYEAVLPRVKEARHNVEVLVKLTPMIEERIGTVEAPFRTAIRRRHHTDLDDQLANYEHQYGFNTDELLDRLQAGEIEENLHVRRWLSLRAIRNRIRRQ